MNLALNDYIEFRNKRDGRSRPFIRGTRVEVSFIVVDHEQHGMSAEEIASGYPDISIGAVHAALGFYHDNRDEVRTMMREDKRIVANLIGSKSCQSRRLSLIEMKSRTGRS